MPNTMNRDIELVIYKCSNDAPSCIPTNPSDAYLNPLPLLESQQNRAYCISACVGISLCGSPMKEKCEETEPWTMS